MKDGKKIKNKNAKLKISRIDVSLPHTEIRFLSLSLRLSSSTSLVHAQWLIWKDKKPHAYTCLPSHRRMMWEQSRVVALSTDWFLVLTSDYDRSPASIDYM